MHKIVLYCKTYRPDFKLVGRLIESIHKHNRDNIPIYISFPKNDMGAISEMGNVNKSSINFLYDEDIVKFNIAQNWYTQQVVKLMFSKTGICKNYVCIDSDSIFIKDFFVSDFMFNNSIPYTICHEQKEVLEFGERSGKTFIYDNFRKDRLMLMELFGRTNTKVYDGGPSPVIWNCDVIETLEREYMIPNNLNYQQLIQQCPSEFTWYLESLLYFKTIPLYPSQPLFKVYHYKEQLDEDMKLGNTIERLVKNYLGIVMQSNWIR